MEITDRISPEPLPRGLVAGDIWQARDAMALKAAMRRRPRELRDRRLKRVETVIQRQQRGDGTRRSPPRLRVDAVAPRQRPQALQAGLNRPTNDPRRRGAPMQHLAHSPSFHSRGKTAPSKPGIKHLSGSHSAAPGVVLELTSRSVLRPCGSAAGAGQRIDGDDASRRAMLARPTFSRFSILGR